MKIAIAAAGGNVGSRIAQNLQNLPNIELVLLGKNKISLDKLQINNAEIRIADISNTYESTKATEDVDALFWMVPPALHVSSLQEWYAKVTEAGINATRSNNIKRVVILSSLGAHSNSNLGTITYSGSMEKSFDKIDTNILALRPGYFMENILLQRNDILEKGKLAFMFSPNQRIPFISTDDIGDTAAYYLASDKWAGKWKLNLMGPENITSAKIALHLSEILNKKIQYHEMSYTETENYLNDLEVSPIVRKELFELFTAFADTKGVYNTPRTHEAITDTSIQQFIRQKLI